MLSSASTGEMNGHFYWESSSPICPVSAVVAYMVIRGSSDGPFFKFQDVHTLHVRTALAAVGLPCDKFVGHSFRIGAATTAARAGFEDSKIRQLGCWNSSAYLGYVQTSRKNLAQLSRTLAQQS